MDEPWNDFQSQDAATTTEAAPWEDFQSAGFDYSKASGVVQPGNIDLVHRPKVYNDDGTVSTEKSISIGTDKGEVLIPTVVNGKIVTEQEAIKHYHDTGENLGVFKDIPSANAAAEAIHSRDQQQPWTDFQPKSTGERIDAAMLPDWLRSADVTAQHVIRRALNLPVTRSPTLAELKEQGLQDISELTTAPPEAVNVPRPDQVTWANLPQTALHDVVGFLESPLGAASPALGFLPPAAQAYTSAGIGAQMIGDAIQKVQEGRYPEAVESAAFGLLGAHGARESIKGEVATPVKPPEGYEVSTEGVTTPPPVPKEFLPEKTSVTADLTRQLADARKGLMAEAQDLQTQANISRAATGTVHPAVQERINAINEELNHPTVGVPVEPNTPVDVVLKAQGVTPPTIDQAIRSGGTNVPRHIELTDGSVHQVAPFNPLVTEGEVSLANGNSVDKSLVRNVLDENKKVIASIKPDEATTRIAQSPASTTPGDVIPGQAAPQPPGQVGVGAGQGGGLPGAGGGAPVVGGLARSTIEDQINAGILPPDALVIGKGWNATEAAAEGDRLVNKGVNPDHVIEAMQGKRYMPVDPDSGKRMDLGGGVAVLESETRRLAAERAAAQNQFGLGSPQARAAELTENNWLRNVRPKAGGLVQRAMKAFEDTTPVDLSDYNDMYKKAAQFQNGKTIPVEQQVEMMRKANVAKTAIKNASDAVEKQQRVVRETLPKVRTPNDAEMQALVDQMVKELTPCK